MSDKDCVSREAVYRLADDLWHLMFNLDEDGDCIDMDAVAEKIHELAKLSPVELPKGHWELRIVDDVDYVYLRRKWYCSECGDWQTYGKTPYCPYCGAKMEENDGE